MALPKGIDAAFDSFASSVYGSEILERKLIELMALSNSVALDCAPCMRHHSEEARKRGATEQEVWLAVAVAMTISAGKNRVKAREALEAPGR